MPTYFRTCSASLLYSYAGRCSWGLAAMLLTFGSMCVSAHTTTAGGSLSSPNNSNQQQANPTRVQQCREGCFDKFATKEILCQQSTKCLRCWDDCETTPQQIKGSKSIRETWSLYPVSMLQRDSLVLVHIAWTPLSTPNQCLVTWEVAGGGLMGNLLTETYSVQLSLWPDTKYRVQVTCKFKLSGAMTRSLPLFIDTFDANTYHANDSTAPTPQDAQSSSTTTDILPTKLYTALHGAIRVDSIESEAAVSREEDNSSASSALSPVDDEDTQSVESLDQHTNFIFDWHNRNNEISAIEPLHKPSLHMLDVLKFSDLRKPLLFGMLAGTLLLTIVLLMYICISYQQDHAVDKDALIEAAEHASSSMMGISVSELPAEYLAAAAKAAQTSTRPNNARSQCHSNAQFSSSTRNPLKM